MKKIISLIASVAMLASMVTSVSAASIATNNPVLSTVIEEIDASAFEEFTYETLEEGQVAYKVTAKLTGLDLSNVRASSEEKAKRTGIVLSAAEYNIVWDSEENIVGTYHEDREAVEDPGIAEQGEGLFVSFLATSQSKMLPKASNSNDTVVTATEFTLNSCVVVIKEGSTVTGTVEGIAAIKQLDTNETIETKNFTKTTIGYDVNGVAGSTVTLGASEPDPEPVPEFDIKAPVKLVSGWAWDVTINGFDSANTYIATFTAGGEEKVNELNFDNAEIGAGSSVSFAALLKTTRDAVELALSK